VTLKKPLPEPYFHVKADGLFPGLALYEGDCFDLMPRMVDVFKFHQIVCDPPYGANYRSRERISRSILNDDGSFLFCSGAELALDLLEHGRQMFLFAKARNGWLAFTAMEEAGVDISPARQIPWDKEFTMPGLDAFLRCHESVFRVLKGRDSKVVSSEHFRDIIRIPKFQGPRLNPHQKPVELLRHLIYVGSAKNEIVFDFCTGSGTTLEAAYLEGRFSVGIELDKDQCKAAADRLENLISKTRNRAA
jgi:DNA modification methylase